MPIQPLNSLPLICFVIFMTLFSYLIGSFLNVVIYRLPLMLKRQWIKECQDYLKQTQSVSGPPFNLAFPASHCIYCQKNIPFWHNIPIFSFLFLKGRSACCQQDLSKRYLYVELLCPLLSFFVFIHYALSSQTLFALILTWTLIALAFIDAEHQLLPDELTLGLLWLGLFLNIFTLWVPLDQAVLGAIFGYGSLWIVAFLFRIWTGKIGMGHGDFKLLAALGAWFGWHSLPFIILFSSSLGVLVGIMNLLRKKQTRDSQISFGPYLAFSGWLMLFSPFSI